MSTAMTSAERWVHTEVEPVMRKDKLNKQHKQLKNKKDRQHKLLKQLKKPLEGKKKPTEDKKKL